MHSQQELTAIAAGKAALRRRIALRRAQCAEAAAQAFRPLALLDEALAGWRKISPGVTVATVALGALLRRGPVRRPRVLGALLRWGPLALGIARSVGAAAKAGWGARKRD